MKKTLDVLLASIILFCAIGFGSVIAFAQSPNRSKPLYEVKKIFIEQMDYLSDNNFKKRDLPERFRNHLIIELGDNGFTVVFDSNEADAIMTGGLSIMHSSDENFLVRDVVPSVELISQLNSTVLWNFSNASVSFGVYPPYPDRMKLLAQEVVEKLSRDSEREAARFGITAVLSNQSPSIVVDSFQPNAFNGSWLLKSETKSPRSAAARQNKTAKINIGSNDPIISDEREAVLQAKLNKEIKSKTLDIQIENEKVTISQTVTTRKGSKTGTSSFLLNNIEQKDKNKGLITSTTQTRGRVNPDGTITIFWRQDVAVPTYEFTMRFRETWKVLGDGKTMTVSREIDTPYGPEIYDLIYEKQS